MSLIIFLIVVCAIIYTFLIDAIIKIIHVGTYITGAFYFFVLMGGLYRKGNTATGAAASLATGSVFQIGVCIDDLNSMPTA